MGKPRKSRKDQDEKQLEKLAKRLLSTPHKPREESKLGKRDGAGKQERERVPTKKRPR